MLKCCYSRKKYLSELKQHGVSDALSEEFSCKCLAVMIYEQCIVSIVELIILSWQPILLYNFHNMRVNWLSYHFFKLQIYTLHSLEDCDLSDVTSFSVKQASYYRRCPKTSEVRRFPFGDSLAQL